MCDSGEEVDGGTAQTGVWRRQRRAGNTKSTALTAGEADLVRDSDGSRGNNGGCGAGHSDARRGGGNARFPQQKKTAAPVRDAAASAHAPRSHPPAQSRSHCAPLLAIRADDGRHLPPSCLVLTAATNNGRHRPALAPPDTANATNGRHPPTRLPPAAANTSSKRRHHQRARGGHRRRAKWRRRPPPPASAE